MGLQPRRRLWRCPQTQSSNRPHSPSPSPAHLVPFGEGLDAALGAQVPQFGLAVVAAAHLPGYRAGSRGLMSLCRAAARGLASCSDAQSATLQHHAVMHQAPTSTAACLPATSHSPPRRPPAALTSSGGPLRSGQHELTMSRCSAIFLSCVPLSASHARTVLSGEHDTRRSPSGVQCTSSTAFLWPAARADGGRPRCLGRRARRRTGTESEARGGGSGVAAPPLERLLRLRSGRAPAARRTDSTSPRPDGGNVQFSLIQSHIMSEKIVYTNKRGARAPPHL